jgi:hypothetical protein
MSDGMSSEVSMGIVVRTEARFYAENGVEPGPEPVEEPDIVVGDLARDFEAELSKAIQRTQRSLQAIEDDLNAAMADTEAGPMGRASLLASFAQMFKSDPRTAALEKLQHVREVYRITEMLSVIAEAFPHEYGAYRHAVTHLNAVLEKNPAYIEFTRRMDAVAQKRGVQPNEVKALMNDAFCVSDDIKGLRTSLKAVLEDPAISPLFRDVENRYFLMDRVMYDVAGATNRLGREKGVDMTGFRSFADLAEKMAQNIDKPLVSRPGGLQMDTPNNSMSENLKRISANIREMIERMIHSVRAAFSPSGPSPAP